MSLNTTHHLGCVMITSSEIQFSASKLIALAEQHGTDCVLTVSTCAYRVIFVPKGYEDIARMELNERLAVI